MARVRVCLCGCFTWMSGRSLDVFWCTAIEKWTSFGSSVLAVRKHPIIVQRKTNCISFCDWDMKLGVLPLWSASKELSNNVIKVIIDDSHFFSKNRTQAKAMVFIILGQNSTHSKIDIIWKLYSCWSQWFKLQIHISFLAQDTYHNSYPEIHIIPLCLPSTWMRIRIVSPSTCIYKWNTQIGIVPMKPFSYWTVQHNPPLHMPL